MTLNAPDRRKSELLALLGRAQAMAESMATASAAEDASLAERLRTDARQHEQFVNAFVLAYISDQPAPISLFKSWASYAQFRVWERERKITLSRRNRKVCVVPSEFFRLWRTIIDAPRPKESQVDAGRHQAI